MDRPTGIEVINWIEENLYVPEGKYVGKELILADFQRDIVLKIYDNEDITRKAIISEPRKSAKTTLAAALTLFHLVGPGARPNSQLVSTALTRDQAGLLYNLAAKMAKMSPNISDYVKLRESKKELYVTELGTTYRALSADANSNLGSSPVFAVHDEVGSIQGPTSDLIEHVSTGCAAQEFPLEIYISTSAATDAQFFSVIIDDAKKAEDPRTVLIEYTCPMEVDAFSEEALTYHPAWNSFINKDELRHTQSEAQRMPSKENKFRNLILNQRIEVDTPYVNKTVWENNGKAPENWHGKDLYISLDLSAKNDMSSMTVIFQNEDGDGLSVIQKSYLPAENIITKSRDDRIPWDVWAKQGHLTLTPGSTVDYSFIVRDLMEFNEHANIVKFGYDDWKFNYFKKDMEHLGIDTRFIEEKFISVRQGTKTMTPMIGALTNFLLDGRIQHGNHPIITMCIQNVKVIGDNTAMRFEKRSANRKIDAAITLVMCCGLIHSYGDVAKKQQSYLVTDDLLIM